MNINDARRKLELFYNGTSTPEDIDDLQRFFAEANSIPSDMEADAAIFIGSISESLHIPAPEEIFTEDFLSEIDQAVKTETRRSRIFRRVIWSTSIAAASLVAVLMFRSSNDSPQTFIHTHSALQADNMYTDNNIQDTIIVHSTSIDVILPLSASTATSTDNTPTVQKTVDEQAIDDTTIRTDYTEISDPQQVAEILNFAYTKISDSFSLVNSSLSDVDSRIVQTANTISSTLNGL